MEITLETITREIALKYLEKNVDNRPLSKPYVRELVSELAEGRFRETHQGIAFDENGNLLDGQHRLHAIAQSGIEVTMPVARGVSRQAFDAIDVGRKRTAGQILAMSGFGKDAAKISQIARALLQTAGGMHRASNAAVDEFAAKHSLVLQKYLPVATKFAPAVAAAFVWAEELGWKDVEDAARRLIELDFSRPGDPMRAFSLRWRTLAGDGQGQAAVKRKFDTTVNVLWANHNHQDVAVARTPTKGVDYKDLERKSVRPPAMASA